MPARGIANVESADVVGGCAWKFGEIIGRSIGVKKTVHTVVHAIKVSLVGNFNENATAGFACGEGGLMLADDGIKVGMEHIADTSGVDLIHLIGTPPRHPVPASVLPVVLSATDIDRHAYWSSVTKVQQSRADFSAAGVERGAAGEGFIDLQHAQISAPDVLICLAAIREGIHRVSDIGYAIELRRTDKRITLLQEVLRGDEVLRADQRAQKPPYWPS